MNLKPFISFSELSIAELDAWQEEGNKIAGVYCIYAPNELIRAAGVVPVSLCGKKQDPIKEAERELPVSLCPLIKSSYGYAITDTCPFFSFSDILIAETTCDGKKKMYELMSKLKPLHLMHLPHTQTGTAPLKYWMDGLRELEKFLFECSGIKVTEEELHNQIVIQNKIRRELYNLAVLAADERSPLNAKEMLTVQESKSFVVHPEKYLASLTTLRTELEEYLKQPDLSINRGLRILMTGCPMGKGSDKAIVIAEELGARVVCMENCSGLKGVTLSVDETGDPYEALARRYLQVPCSCMTPNPHRPESIKEMVDIFKVDAVVDMTWLGCHTYNAESTTLRRFVEEELELPFLHIETDYSDSDIEQLRTRIEAFVELSE
ncbi:Benzoyl-CoA reductase/2-hydroxyglutaryl-CoA dehydratase subunit, BcrC/BadD/HgdB [Maridesulfovibrio ferrireducens]|uniref:Benzoyl-CoA reductase/2-hydroxyglutaryl-CoA dehydratase subunit, BcrC/BadD/HgdB n=1 Tax=Maridesulfovibrio ferrireducens TaxID=246191 RepID=A0A1G9JKX6_9BACT|nr:double-cubane-cluster-containing anaerobic reductase [Maridesulfovibrio ferrireducens]SDL37754.1 Benzoyl-CoA reductase/2-hydroxyglutaryl-CoA dehydratase subunit, BcrC/BadD/HgdB [Maridesulfovibrio ferrireducens]